MMIRVLAWMCATACAFTPLAAQQRPDSTYTLRVAGAPVLRIDLARADVQLRAGKSGIVRIHVESLGSPAAPTPLTLAQTGDTVQLSATDSSAGVRLVVEAPPGSRIDASLARGDIRARGVDGAMVFNTTRGDVILEDVVGSAIVDVRNGSIRASFRSLATDLPSAFITLNGNVRLDLPTDASAQLDVRCRGCTLDDIPQVAGLEPVRLLTSRDGDPVLGLDGAIGSGGAALRVFTWNGEVTVRIR